MKKDVAVVQEQPDDVPVEVKRAIVQRQIALHQNGRYEAQVLVRVNKSIGTPPEQLKAYTDDLVRLEKMLDALKAELAALG